MKKDYLIFLPISLLITIIILLLTGNIEFLDNLYYNIVVHNDIITNILRIITNLGGFLYIFIICIGLLIFYKNKRDLLDLYLIIIISTLLNRIIKSIFARPRPNLVHLVTEDSYSFPSGHAMASMTFYGYIIYLVWKSNMSKRKKIILTSFLSILILVIGYSRIYLNVHYISDVIAGFMFSIILLYTFINVKNKKFSIMKK